MKEITAHEFKRIVETHQNNPEVDLVNVCSPAEYQEQHIEGVRNVPLDTLANHIDEFKGKKQIYIHCRSGKRGAQAVKTLAELGVQAELVNVSGGLLAWDGAGLPTRALTNRLPIMRQVMIAAGVLVMTGVVLGFLVHDAFLGLALFVGAGLTFAGVTGWCGMSKVLAYCPWNR